jgi:hypothetical protein
MLKPDSITYDVDGYLLSFPGTFHNTTQEPLRTFEMQTTKHEL